MQQSTDVQTATHLAVLTQLISQGASWQEAQSTASSVEAIYISALESICEINLMLIYQKSDCTEDLQTAVYHHAARKSRDMLPYQQLTQKRREGEAFFFLFLVYREGAQCSLYI